MSVDCNHHLPRFWSGSREYHFNQLKDSPPYAVIGFDLDIKISIIHTPIAITCKHDPSGGDAGIPIPEAGKVGEKAILGFKGQNFSGMHAVYLYVDSLGELITGTAPPTMDYLTELLTPPTQVPYLSRDNQVVWVPPVT